MNYVAMYFIPSVQNVVFSELVVKCQELVRKFAYEQLKNLGIEDSEAKLRATSCVSQRDIQVVTCSLARVYVMVLHREYLHFMFGFLKHMKCYKSELITNNTYSELMI